MPEFSLVFALVTAVGTIGFVALVLVAIVARYRQRPVPAPLGWLAALCFGLSLSLPFIILIRYPLLLAGALLLPAIAVVFLMRSGRFRSAGAVLVGVCLPGAAWWGSFLVQDPMDPLISYAPELWLWWLPEVVGLVMAVGLILMGDVRGAQPRLMPEPAGVARDPLIIGNSIYRATQIGPFSLPSVVADGGGVVVLLLGLPVLLTAGIPWPLVLAAGAFGYAVFSTVVWYLAIPSRVRAAWEGFAAVGHPEMARWRRDTGTAVPTSRTHIDAWLRDNAEQPVSRWARSELLAVVGQLDEARAVAERMGAASADERLEQTALLAYIGWIEGADPRLDELESLAADVGTDGSVERTLARGKVMVARSRHAAATGGDWMAPLIELRREMGPIAAAWFRQDALTRRFRVVLLIGLLISGLIVLGSTAFPG